MLDDRSRHTHTWIWWVNDDAQLPAKLRLSLEANESGGLGVNDISVLEVARLVAGGRLDLPLPIHEWVEAALNYPYISSIRMTPEIAITSTTLPEPFHKDPADRIIVASAIILDAELATADRKILDYPHVRTVK